ncbi:MAG: tetratricopeptide repeat protein [Rhodoferax sp.]|nr:tetratricopeptide repeat protein [Rhodoferax sp.]
MEQVLRKADDFLASGRLAVAECLYQTVLATEPKHPQANYQLGRLAVLQGQVHSALPYFAAAKQFGKNGVPPAKDSNKLARLFKERRLPDAKNLATSLTRNFPGHGPSWHMLGLVSEAQGDLDAALAAMQTAVHLSATDPQLHANLGRMLMALGRLNEAEASYHQALTLKPGDVHAHINLGNLQHELSRFADAEASYQRALSIDPNNGLAHSNLGRTAHAQGRFKEAEPNFRRAVQCLPDNASLLSNLLFCQCLNGLMDADALFAAHREFSTKFEVPLRRLWPQHTNPHVPDRRLKIGFVSGDLRNHAAAFFIEPMFEALATDASLNLFAYANHPQADAVTQRLRRLVPQWQPVFALGDRALADTIRADGIDILVDLSGHSAHNRMLSFAHKPAPLQVGWMGYPGTTGLQALDYYLGDRFLLPPGKYDHLFTEKLVRLPAYAAFKPQADAPPVNDLPALHQGYVTFGSFNRPNKISREVIALWSAVLRAVPSAHMVLGGFPPEGQYNTVLAAFADEGIARERLHFHQKTNMRAYLELHHQVDICLDTFPYNGGITTMHALWMGVPTLTLAGHTVGGRMGAGIQGHVALGGFVAEDAAAFVQQGLHWAQQGPALASLRAGLRERFSGSALGQPALAGAGLVRALRLMWQRYCAGLPAASFEVRAHEMPGAK